MDAQRSILKQHWGDILPPSAPVSHTEVWLLVSSILFLLVAVAVAVLWQYRPRQRALRVLRDCQRRLRMPAYDTRLLAQRIYAAMARVMTVRRGQQIAFCDDRHWQGFYQRLQRGVFDRQAPSVSELTELIEDARARLKHRKITTAKHSSGVKG